MARVSEKQRGAYFTSDDVAGLNLLGVAIAHCSRPTIHRRAKWPSHGATTLNLKLQTYHSQLTSAADPKQITSGPSAEGQVQKFAAGASEPNGWFAYLTSNLRARLL